MTLPIMLQVGTRGARTLANRSFVSARVVRITYCDEEDRWQGMPGDLGRKVHAALKAREPWLLCLGFKERVVYAGLVAAVELMRAGFAERVVVLPLDWVTDPEAEPADFAEHLPLDAALAFAVVPDLAPSPAGPAASAVLDGPLVYVSDPDAGDAFVDAVDSYLRLQSATDASLESVVIAWVLQGRAGVFRQRLAITPGSAASWRNASPAQLECAFVQSNTPSDPFVFNRLEHRAASFVWQRPEFHDMSDRNTPLRDRLRTVFRTHAATDDPYRGSADPISGAEQHMLRKYLCQVEAGAAQGWKDRFVQWMLCADESFSSASRIEWAIYRHRPDLQTYILGARSGDPGRLLRQWFVRHGLSELGFSLIRRADVETRRVPPRSAPHANGKSAAACDVRIVGYLDSVLGLGTSARNHRDALRLAGISTVSTAVPLIDAAVAKPILNVPMNCRVSLLAVNGDRLHEAIQHLDAETLARSYRIGLWNWELPRPSPSMLSGLAHVDEVWVPSGFTRDAFQPHTRKTIRVVPIPIPLDHPEDPGYDDLLPNAPYFFFAFDYQSAAERKNPLGLISAFMSAFPDGSGPHLVIKALNAGDHAETHERLLGATLRRRDIHLVDGIWPRGLVHRALRNSLAVVSLHRAEGFGLLLAEAMAYGKPTIATGYSGNLEFQHPGNSMLVDYKMTQVSAECRQYEAGEAWAEPDIDGAAKAMRAVFKGGRDIDSLAHAGAQTVRERLAPEVIGRQMKKLLEKHLGRTDGAASIMRQWRRLLGN